MPHIRISSNIKISKQQKQAQLQMSICMQPSILPVSPSSCDYFTHQKTLQLMRQWTSFSGKRMITISFHTKWKKLNCIINTPEISHQRRHPKLHFFPLHLLSFPFLVFCLFACLFSFSFWHVHCTDNFLEKIKISPSLSQKFFFGSNDRYQGLWGFDVVFFHVHSV